MFIIKFIFKIINWALNTVGMFTISLVCLCIFTSYPEDLFKALKQPPILKKADTIIILGAGVTEHGWPDRVSLERAIKGVILYKQGYSHKIIFSGGIAKNGVIAPAQAMANIANDLGVPKTDLYVDDTSTDTYENGINSAKIMNKNKMNTAILVTSDAHMKRSLAVFTKLNIPVYPQPVEEELVEKDGPIKGRFQNFILLYEIFYETSAMLKYKKDNRI